MGLSEREQKLFEQLERELAGDSQFANKVASSTSKPAKGKLLVAGVLVMLSGVGLLLLAVSMQVAFFGVVAFLVMLIGLVVASSNFDASRSTASEAQTQPKPKRGNFFEERWDRRFGE